MDTSYHPPQSPSGHQLGSVVWFISFGDLLTLLLCFFLVLTPWEKLRSVNQSETKQRVTGIQETEGGFGTPFAQPEEMKRVEMLAEIPILQRYIKDQGDLDIPWFARVVATEVDWARARGGEVTVKLCAREVDRVRLFAQVGALFKRPDDRQIPVRIEVSPGCEDFEFFRPVSEPIVGVVSVIGA